MTGNGTSVTDGIFKFPQNGDAVAGKGSVNFFGSVAFSGHNNLLDTQISNLELKFLGDDNAELIGSVTANSMAGENLINNKRVTIAKVVLNTPKKNEDNSVAYTSNGVTLTEDGAKSFGNYYPAGTKVSELAFTVGSSAEKGELPTGGTIGPEKEKEKTNVGGNTISVPVSAETAAETCVARTVTGGTMNWNFKSSFVNYVGGLSDGKISASGVSQGSGFNWSGGSGKYNQDASKGLVSFGGSVQFSGHGGVMDSKFSNMRVQLLGANSAALIANVVANDANGKSSTMNGVQIGTISLAGKQSTSGNTLTWSNASVTLTAAGAKAFGGFYQAGEVLDPITITASLGGETTCDSSTGTLAATGMSEQSVGVAASAVALLVAGAGVVLLNRRKLAPVRR